MYRSSNALIATPELFTAPKHSFKALILDDSNFDRLRLKRHINGTGMPVQVDEISCLCLLEGALARRSYDLIIIDYYLPDGNGEEALDMIYSHPLQRSAMALLTSGNSWKAEIGVQKLPQNTDFIAKSRLSSEILARLLHQSVARVESL